MAGKSGFERPDAADIRNRFCDFYVALSEEAQPHLRGHGQPLWLERLEQDHVNIRQALTWLIEDEQGGTALRLSSAVWWFWYVQAHLNEGLDWLTKVLAMPFSVHSLLVGSHFLPSDRTYRSGAHQSAAG